MLDTDTKRRIDTARDILVGKVPDPKSQVEQITIALIYKFMDDMDAEAEELGGKRKFFEGEYARYGWAKLMRSGLSGFETLNLYAEAIAKMPENPGIPRLFRDIFKNAYLPYRDPETLKSFLKIIDEFTYDHSEKLGDAFEYLLSVLGSQGDAGQFRTPRHIIDFMVSIVDPKKTESILDPACGTAGFLISAYKHIVQCNTDAKGNVTLTPDEKGRIAQNLKGYDISPDMVRLSLVNLYLHGFTDPHIIEYDTLTSEEKWNELADVILANPPFMSPKGGIKPHKRFSVQSKRSEVLFVDYMAEHLTPTGRAGIIVPEGVMFQSGGAYKELRKMLVESSLVAVISLPAGVFNPYSGVKTSILILDRTLAKQSDTIGFFKIENDGYGLGAQRRAIEKNDLPQCIAEVTSYLSALRNREGLDGLHVSFGLIVPKAQISQNDEFTLSGERYRIGEVATSSYPFVSLANVCTLVRGVTYTKADEVEQGGLKVLRANNIDQRTSSIDLTDVKRISASLSYSDDKLLKKDDIFICLASGSKDHIGKVAFVREDTDFYFGGFMGSIRSLSELVNPLYLYYQLSNQRFNEFLREQIAGANINNLSSSILYRYNIPLPPLDVQKEIVAEIEGYQKVIDGARAVVENYRPHIPIDSDWPMVKLGDACQFIDYRGRTPEKTSFGIPLITAKNVRDGYIDPEPREYIADSEYESWMTRGIPKVGDVLFTTEAPLGNAALVTMTDRFALAQRLIALSPDRKLLIGPYLKDVLISTSMREKIFAHQTGSTVYGIKASVLKEITVPVPPLEVQKEIVSDIESEQALVASTKELITRFEKKIQAAIARVWGEDTATAEVE